MSPALNRSSAIQRFEGSNAIEIHNGITFDFYMGLPHISLGFNLQPPPLSQSPLWELLTRLQRHAWSEHLRCCIFLVGWWISIFSKWRGSDQRLPHWCCQNHSHGVQYRLSSHICGKRQFQQLIAHKSNFYWLASFNDQLCYLLVCVCFDWLYVCSVLYQLTKMYCCIFSFISELFMKIYMYSNDNIISTV